MPFNARLRPNIASERFDSENPSTWGLAPPPRQVFGLAVHDDRLYYAVSAGPQVWSIGIQRDGSFAADPRWELDVPAQSGPLAVSDIAFSLQGQMILAQRGTLAASYDYSAFTRPGEPKVLRFSLKAPNEPPSPGRWTLTPSEYAVGFAGTYRNTNGGVALGYGYGPDGILNTAACEQAVWTTGQKLRNDPAMRSELEPGGPLLVDGLQGSPAGPTREFNAPPTTSYFIDYDDAFDDARATGHLGSVRILTRPCPPAVAAPRRPLSHASIPATMIATTGTPQACTPTCICPPGTVEKDGECVKPPDPCPTPGMPCGPGPGTGAPTVPGGPQVCNPPMVPGPAPGSCRCPDGTVQQGRTCVPQTNACRAPKIPGPCACPPGLVEKDGLCVPGPVCPPPMVPGADPNTCVCPKGTVLEDDKCVPATPIDLGVEKDGGTTPAPVGYYSWTIKVTNTGAPFSGTGAFTITDVLPPGMSFTSVSGAPDWSCPTSVPAGRTLTCTYVGTGPPSGPLSSIFIGAFVPGNGPFPPYTNCAIVAVDPASGLQDTNSSNDQGCKTVTKPPIVCQSPMVPGAVPGSCECRSGTVLKGKECVPQTACQQPMVPGPIPGVCICPDGTVQDGKECVPKQSGCPDGTVKRGTQCV